ncbi:hypothetical protein DFS34DRAFT_596387 [Phlyctochytrium arcticum]|nr:hypothetical protein DFS34DRAFT_596387 [Phlyctochytrium arcticum]
MALANKHTLVVHKDGASLIEQSNLAPTADELLRFSADARDTFFLIFQQLLTGTASPRKILPLWSEILRKEKNRLRKPDHLRVNPFPPPPAFLNHPFTDVADPARMPQDEADEDETDSDKEDADSGWMKYDLPLPSSLTLPEHSPHAHAEQPADHTRSTSSALPDRVILICSLVWKSGESGERVVELLRYFDEVVEEVSSANTGDERFSAVAQAVCNLFIDSLVVFDGRTGCGYKVFGWVDDAEVYLF